MNTEQKILLQKEIIESLKTLQQSTLIKPWMFATWFDENIHNAYSAFIEKPCRVLTNIGSSDFILEVKEEALYCVFNLVRYYEDAVGERLKVERLNDYLPNVLIEQQGLAASERMLHVCVNVNLDKWPGLIPYLLHNDLHRALVAKYNDLDIKVALKKVNAVLTRYYPDITIDFLNIAVSLGMVDHEGSAFVDWFTNHRALALLQSSGLPSDISTSLDD